MFDWANIIETIQIVLVWSAIVGAASVPFCSAALVGTIIWVKKTEKISEDAQKLYCQFVRLIEKQEKKEEEEDLDPLPRPSRTPYDSRSFRKPKK